MLVLILGVEVCFPVAVEIGKVIYAWGTSVKRQQVRGGKFLATNTTLADKHASIHQIYYVYIIHYVKFVRYK